MLTTAPDAHAEITWRGDFETGNTSQWSNVLNESGVSIVGAPVAEGEHAAKILITDAKEHIWPNGINRVEFNHSPPDGNTSEGSDTYFGWSFLLPQVVTEDNHQIGYVESKNSWQQMMSFPVAGSTIRFVTRKPGNQEQWKAEGALKTNEWHDVALHIHWSQDAEKGFVSVWFDGKQVVERAKAQTLADDNPHFFQLGMLRNKPIETDETIFVDNARAGSSIEAVLALAPSTTATPKTGSGGDDGSPGSSSGADGSDDDDASDDGSGADDANDDGAGTSDQESTEGDSKDGSTGETDEDSGGCSFSARISSTPQSPWTVVLGAAGLTLLSLRRRGVLPRFIRTRQVDQAGEWRKQARHQPSDLEW